MPEFGQQRREFLRSTIGAALGSSLSQRHAFAAKQPGPEKIVVVTFGGGARDDETFSELGQENIPRLLGEMAPRSTFYSEVVNRGILGHYVATASLATGVYETFNNFADVAPAHPTVFEYFRRDLKRPATDVWVIAPSNGFQRIGESAHRSFRRGSGAGVILPKRLLATAVGSPVAPDYEHLLQDSYEGPVVAPSLSGNVADLTRVGEVLDVSSSDFVAHARNMMSPDEMSMFVARHLMKRLAPSFLWITLHDIDVAHCGAFSLYVEAIRRTDSLCADLWRFLETDPSYKGKTALFILPDFGRDSDTDPGGNGFQHHRTGDMQSRTTWMMALGSGIRENVVVNRPIDSVDLVPTLGKLLGFTPEIAKGAVLSELA